RNLVTYTETVSLSRRWHDINDIIDRAVAVSRHDLEANGVRLERRPVERLPMVYVDGRQLEKVFALVLDRPAHASAHPGSLVTVAISVTRLPTPDDHVTIVIADDARVDGPETGPAGLGASRRIVEAHGGTLTAVPAGLSGGTRVTIDLPIAAASPTK